MKKNHDWRKVVTSLTTTADIFSGMKQPLLFIVSWSTLSIRFVVMWWQWSCQFHFDLLERTLNGQRGFVLLRTRSFRVDSHHTPGCWYSPTVWLDNCCLLLEIVVEEEQGLLLQLLIHGDLLSAIAFVVRGDTEVQAAWFSHPMIPSCACVMLLDKLVSGRFSRSSPIIERTVIGRILQLFSCSLSTVRLSLSICVILPDMWWVFHSTSRIILLTFGEKWIDR